MTQRRTVAADTPAREATSASVSPPGVDSACSFVVDAAISGSLKSLSVNHSDPIREPTDEPIASRREDPTGNVGTVTQHHGNQIHLHPTAALAERVLLPGDPGRALALAQFLLERPLMFNHHRGLWGYTGTAADGELLTVQSTGMGGPSAAIVLHELIALGVTRAIRVGTCGALNPSLGLGDLVVAREAIAADGTSVALGADGLVQADPTLTDALVAQLSAGDGRVGALTPRLHGRAWHHGRIVSTDLFYESDSARNVSWSAGGALVVEMETSALFAVGTAASIQVACILAVSDTFDGPDARQRIGDDALLEAAEAMGNAAAAALSV